MHRLTPALLAALALTLALTSLALADVSNRPLSPDQDLVLDLYMSGEAGGELARSFVSGTNAVHAVLDYENARGQQYVLRVTDLSGITVFSDETEVLNGAGSWTTSISVTDFVETYRQNISAGETAIGEDMTALDEKCQDIPEVPAVWPPSDPNPSDDYSKWLKDVLDRLESARSASLEVTRTLQAMIAMPDVMTDAELYDGLRGARQGIGEAEMKLGEAKPKLRPETGRPDPQAGCGLIDEAKTSAETAGAAIDAAIGTMPEGVPGWRLPTVSGRYDDGGEFLGCQQYSTDIIQLINGSPADSPTKGLAWGVGDAGAPALVFPGSEEADRSSVGRLDVMYVGGAEAMYAQTVQVPGLNREAMIGAFVTDEKCIPIDGQSVTFAVDPAEAGSVEPAMVELDQGEVAATLTSGDIAARARVEVVIGEGEDLVSGRGEFSVIGPADTVEFKGLRRNVLNRAAQRERDRRISLSVFASDANNEPVANLTEMLVEVRNDPNDIATPGVLAYDRVRLSTGVRETVELGKRAELAAWGGFSQIPSCESGYRCENLYLMAGSEADGRLTLVATVDGKTAEARVEIVTQPQIYLPFLITAWDVYAPPTYVVIPTEVPMATPAAAELLR